MPHDLYAINIKQFSEDFPMTIVKWKVSDLDVSTRWYHDSLCILLHKFDADLITFTEEVENVIFWAVLIFAFPNIGIK